MSTPYYEFDLSTIANNIEQLKHAINPDNLFYALKANSELEILNKINICNGNFEVASIGELTKLKKLGVDTKNIICSSPIKTEETIMTLYNEGVRYFVFDDLNEYNKLTRLAPTSKKILRLNINHLAKGTIDFGMTEYQLIKYINKKIPSNDIAGMTFYIAKNKDINVMLSVLSYCEHIINFIGNDKIININVNGII